MSDDPVHVRIFLASPGDLHEERGRAREVVESINRQMGRRLGWHLDLLGWEDTLPGAGRPQSLINEDVDACDLFIGVLYKRWGSSPGGESDYTSGFEEEFERARSRHLSTKKPEIWLFFKDFDAELLGDPGEQLQRVIDFRHQQESRSEFLYKRFGGLGDWSSKLYEYLGGYLAKLHATKDESEAAGPESSALASSAAAATAVSGTVPSSFERGTKQLHQAMDRAIAALDSSTANISELPDLDLARLYLAVGTWMARRRTSETIPVHAWNVIYKQRNRVEPTRLERWLLDGTTIGASVQFENRPGWFWLRRLSAAAQIEAVRTLVFVAPSREERVGALNLLRDAAIELPPDFDTHTWLTRIVAQGWAPAVRSALAYLGAVGDDVVRADLEAAAFLPEEFEPDAVDAQMQISYRLDPKSCFEKAVDMATPPARLISSLSTRRFRVERETGEKALTHVVPQIREIAIDRMRSSRVLKKSDVAPLLTSDSFGVRREAVRAIVDQGWQYEVENLLRAAKAPEGKHVSMEEQVELQRVILESRPVDELKKLIEWYSLEGPLAYQALGLKAFEKVEPFIRSDLDEGFARLKEEQIADYRARFGAFADDLINKWTEGVETMLRHQFTAAALKVLTKHGTPSDKDFARRFFASDDSDVKQASLDLLECFGDSSDVDAIVPVVDDYWVRERAATIALRLASDPEDVASRLVESSETDVVRQTIDFLREKRTGRDIVKSLLWHDDEDVRRAASAYFAAVADRGELSEMLGFYLDSGRYFYNVVVWFDRMLYAKGALRTHFKQRLLS